MKVFTLALACLVLLAIECALTWQFGLSIARADVHVAAILFLALRCSTVEGAIGAFAIGYFVDVLSGQPTGLYLFSSVLTFLLSRLAAPFVEIKRARAFAPLAGAVDLAHNLAIWVLLLLGPPAEATRSAVLEALVPSALLTSVAALAVWAVLAGLEGLFRKPETGLLL